MAWAIGERILDNDFIVQGILGTGGMGVVYLVVAEPSGRPNRPYVVSGISYAAKRIRKLNDLQRETLISEIQNWRELPDHPHILPYRFFRQIDHDLVVFAEYAAGGSVADMIARDAPMTLQQALDVAIQSAEGLAAIHARGLVHQDVKPHNLLLHEDGRLVVADFGLAAVVSRMQEADRATGEVAVHGRTLAYASPEQHGGGNISAASDVWSWGVSILELFNGGPLNAPGAQAEAALTRRLRQGPLRAGAPPLPPGVSEILSRCFEQDPAQRWSDLYEVAQLLVDVYERDGETYPRSLSAVEVPADDGPDFERDSRWFAARRRLNDVDDFLFEEWDAAYERQDESRLDRLDELMQFLPKDTTAISADIGRSPAARAINALRMLRGARMCLQGLIALGREDLTLELADLDADLVDEHIHLGDQYGAREFAAERTQLLQKLAADGRSDVLPMLMSAIRQEAVLLDDTGNSADALSMLQKGIALGESLLSASASESSRSLAPALRDKLADELFTLFAEYGVVCLASRRAPEAVRSLRKAFSFQKATNAPIAPSMAAWAHIQLGNALDADADGSEEAISAYRSAVAILEAEPWETALLSTALLNEGITHMRRREFAAAESCIRRAVDIRAPAAEAPSWEERHDLAYALLTMSKALRGRHEFAAAEESADQALRLWEQLVEREGHVQLGQYQYEALMETAQAGAEIGFDG
jgi:serine/threonine protein kinase